FIFLAQEFRPEGPVFSTSACMFIASVSCKSSQNSTGHHLKLPKTWNSYGRWNTDIAFAWLKWRMNRGVLILRKTFKNIGLNLWSINGKEIHLRDRRSRFIARQGIGLGIHWMPARKPRLYR